LNKLLKEKKATLQALGSKRDTLDEQANHLTKIASNFQTLTSSAITAQYWEDSVFDTYPLLKLATAVVDRNELLSLHFATYGHKFKFEAKDAEEDGLALASGSNPGKEAVSRQFSNLDSIHEGCLVDIEELLPENTTIPLPEPQGIFKWLTGIYKNCRGFEMGTFDPSVLTATMHAQSEKWENFALGYIGDIIALTHFFVVTSLREICRDERVWRGLVSVLTDHLVPNYEAALNQAKFILKVERSRTPMTLNHYFNDNLEKW
jgi:hypothetical protein